MTKQELNNKLRASFIARVSETLANEGYEVLTTNSNQIAIPCVDEEQNDEYVVITFQIPKGSRDGDAYDGYAEAESYAMKVTDKAEKAKAAAIAKAAKIERDKKMREQKAAAKAKHTPKAES